MWPECEEKQRTVISLQSLQHWLGRAVAVCCAPLVVMTTDSQGVKKRWRRLVLLMIHTAAIAISGLFPVFAAPAASESESKISGEMLVKPTE